LEGRNRRIVDPRVAPIYEKTVCPIWFHQLQATGRSKDPSKALGAIKTSFSQSPTSPIAVEGVVARGSDVAPATNLGRGKGGWKQQARANRNNQKSSRSKLKQIKTKTNECTLQQATTKRTKSKNKNHTMYKIIRRSKQNKQKQASTR
jgi:hypothetical protein